jgi:hypothetical protein
LLFGCSPNRERGFFFPDSGSGFYSLIVKNSNIMKSFIISILLLLFYGALTAQEQTLFGRTHVTGGFGGPIFEYGLNNKLGTSVGGGGGIVLKHFFIGGYGLGSVDFEYLRNNNTLDKVDIGHGGLWLGLTIPTDKLIHLYASGRFGWGAVNIPVDNPNFDFRDADQIFVMTPEAGIELNIFRWFRIAGTVGYRYTYGTNENRGYADKDFSGSHWGLTMRFGGF